MTAQQKIRLLILCGTAKLLTGSVFRGEMTNAQALVIINQLVTQFGLTN